MAEHGFRFQLVMEDRLSGDISKLRAFFLSFVRIFWLEKHLIVDGFGCSSRTARPVHLLDHIFDWYANVFVISSFCFAWNHNRFFLVSVNAIVPYQLEQLPRPT